MSTALQASAPPPGWRFEQLGIINTVEFTCPGCKLFWTDGEWFIGARGAYRPAPAVPQAGSLREARDIGCSWLHSLSNADQLPWAAEALR